MLLLSLATIPYSYFKGEVTVLGILSNLAQVIRANNRDNVPTQVCLIEKPLHLIVLSFIHAKSRN